MNTCRALALLAIATSPLFAQQAPAPAEIPAETQQHILKLFPEADANKDGKLSAEEARAFRPRVRVQSKNERNLEIQPRTRIQSRPAAQRQLRRVPTHTDVRYGPHERNVLDFWKAESDQPTPVLVFIHGGGFIAGDKSGVEPALIEACLSSKISLASINYRYTTQAPYPAPMLDGVRAIQFIRSKSAEWKIDSLRIGAVGGSAGAGISMWAGFHDDLAKPDSNDPIERESSRLTCIGSMGGQSSYDPLQIKEWLGGRAWEHPAFKPFYAIKTNEELEKPEVRKLAHDASVINHLTKDDPPIFMLYDEPDEPLSGTTTPGTGIHHPKFGHILKEKMDGLGIEAVYRHAKDGKSPPAVQAMVEWLTKRLASPVK